MAEFLPDTVAVASPTRRFHGGQRVYATMTFAELETESSMLASGLAAIGVVPGTRMALLLRPGVEFMAVAFALFKAGAVTILIDPGMGRRNLVRCLAEARPEGFVTTPIVQWMRRALSRRFPFARHNVTVGRRRLGGGLPIARLRELGRLPHRAHVAREDAPAAIIFTSGSTGPPKGVLYRHGNFDHQVRLIRDHYQIHPGGRDLACFPLFGLFNVAMGVSTVVPNMNASRPARANPRKIVEAIGQWQVTQSFGSPAIWTRVGEYCEKRNVRLPSLVRVFAAGAPVPAHMLARMKACMEIHAEIHTPYGATEALPIASISADEVLGETSHRTRMGAGVCVGRRFPQTEWKIIQATSGPIERLEQATEMPTSEIGELIVAGPQVTVEYATGERANELAKIHDGQRTWHRMGDAGYLDADDRFWFCGRMAHRVLTADGPMYSVCCEAIFNNHPDVFRSALVGIGPAGQQRPAIVVEPWSRHMPRTAAARKKLIAELREMALGSPLTRNISDFLLRYAMPVDVRHNVKIFREKLAVWAERRLRTARPGGQAE